MAELPAPLFFETPSALRRWFDRNHNKVEVLWIGFYRISSGLPSITYPEALDEALCWGWIDGLKKRRDDVSYVQRFTPRKARSIWSNVNIAKVELLEATGRMQQAGRDAFAKRSADRTGVYSFEQKIAPALSAERQRDLHATEAALAFFKNQSAYYQRTAIHWVESAKQEATRQRRFELLKHHSTLGERLPQYQPTPKSNT